MHSLALIIALLFTISCGQTFNASHAGAGVAGDAEEEHLHGHHEAETVSSMAGSHAHLGPHFRWTPLRAANHTDQATAGHPSAAARGVGSVSRLSRGHQ